MNSLIKRFGSGLMALVLVLSLFVGALPTDVFATSITYSTEYNSGTRDVLCTTLDGTGAAEYYTSSYTFDTLSQQGSSQLYQSLHTLMTNTHTYTSSYDDCHYKADRTDCQNEDGRVLLLYTSYSATMDQWNGWNREHVWPKSLGGNNTSGGGADLHHIRPSDAGVNSSRGNKKYGNSNNGTAKYGTNPATGCLGGHYNSTYFEPLDNVKGDVARICLYVYVRWGSSWGADSITEVFQSVDVLLEWMELDPVDTWEMGRNEVVENIQGNRNVFIDYPEYAWLLFGRDVPADITTPSDNDGVTANPGGNTTPPTTNPPATNPPATNPPATNPPATNPPATNPPATNPPATQPPASQPGTSVGTQTSTPATQPSGPVPMATKPLDPNDFYKPTEDNDDSTLIIILVIVAGVAIVAGVVVYFVVLKPKKAAPPVAEEVSEDTSEDQE